LKEFLFLPETGGPVFGKDGIKNGRLMPERKHQAGRMEK